MKELLRIRLQGALMAIVATTMLAGGVLSLFNSTERYIKGKPQVWTERDIEMIAGDVAIPNIINGNSKINYQGTLLDIDYDDKIDVVANGSWIEMIAQGYEERIRQRSKNEGWMMGKFETLDEKTRKDLTHIYTAQKDFMRDYIISKGLYSTNRSK